MNDPGLDEPIADHAEDVENIKRDEEEAEEEDESDYLEPAIWWFASTAFPLMAGTFGPMASAFSICALAVHWRVQLLPDRALSDAIDLPDPGWLIAVNAAQLGIALVSNLFLLMNMARKVRFSVAQPITIIGWYFSSFALIALCILANRRPMILEPRETHGLSQAFYYALFAAGLYFICASLMLITVWGAYKNYYESEFQLTMSQRTLMLQTISFLTYLLCGAAVFARIEGWTFLDGVYWADFTLLTVGIGDLSPITHLGRSLLFPYAIVGIIILGLVIGSIRSLVLERGKERMGKRMVEKERRRLLRKLEDKNKGKILKPITKSDQEKENEKVGSKGTKYPKTERERRHQEFHLMRKIQSDAHRKRRWTSLFISLTTWMALWFVGAAIFQVCEKEQGWSYFISLYFSYTSLLTIGYGDFYPTSNSGKAFFVFWSLLAVPSLTILISNMGDTIVKSIRDLTLWIGNFTVLPGEKGFSRTFKETAHRISKGRVFSEYGGDNEVEELPPDILGEGKKLKFNFTQRKKNDPESTAQKAEGEKAEREHSTAHKKGKSNDKLPKNKHHYHLLLIREISSVLSHLNSSPPRKYTFEEWAWYLKLVGEDEGDGFKHRKPVRKPKQEQEKKKGGAENRDGQDEEGIGGGGDGEVAERGEVVKWSWVGNRSPLMGGKEEAEWVLERLTKTLEMELEEIKRVEAEEGEEVRERSSSSVGKSGNSSGTRSP